MLEKFRKRLSGTFRDGSINIVCLGDSVTHGCFESGGGMHSAHDVFASYTVKLHKALHTLFPSVIFNVINSGIGGETAALALKRFDRDVLAYHPDLVVIAFGVNDFGDRELYLRSLGAMFDILNEHGIPAVYMTEHMMNTYSAEDTAPTVKEYSKVTAKAQTDGTMDAMFEGGKALAAEIGMCRRSETEIFVTVPIFDVMTAGIPFFGKIGNLILTDSRLFQERNRIEIHAPLRFLIRENKRMTVEPERRPLLDFQPIQRNMFHIQADRRIHIVYNCLQCLSGQSIHQVQADIFKLCPACQPNGFVDIGSIMRSATKLQIAVVKRLSADTQTVDSQSAEAFHLFAVCGFGVQLH